jgi:hypothetical protein
MACNSRKSTWTKMITAALLLGVSGSALAGFDFVFTPNTVGGFGNYHWDVSIEGAPVAANPQITLLRGATYSLHANTISIHPFWIKTAPSTGSLNAYTGSDLSGTNPLTAAGTLTFSPTATTPDTLYYDCGNHIEMQGVIHVITDPIFANNFE